MHRVTTSLNSHVVKVQRFADAKSAKRAFERAKLDQKSYLQSTCVLLKRGEKTVDQKRSEPVWKELKNPLQNRIAHFPEGVDLHRCFDQIFGSDE